MDRRMLVDCDGEGAAEAKSGASAAVFGGHFTDSQRYSVLVTLIRPGYRGEAEAPSHRAIIHCPVARIKTPPT